MPFNWIPYITLILFGGTGQLFRVLQGIEKAIRNKEKLSMGRVLSSLIIGFMTGGLVGILAKDWRMAFLGGYAGTDFIEGLARRK